MDAIENLDAHYERVEREVQSNEPGRKEFDKAVMDRSKMHDNLRELVLAQAARIVELEDELEDEENLRRANAAYANRLDQLRAMSKAGRV